jgi:hypothetical protein
MARDRRRTRFARWPRKAPLSRSMRLPMLEATLRRHVAPLGALHGRIHQGREQHAVIDSAWRPNREATS